MLLINIPIQKRALVTAEVFTNPSPFQVSFVFRLEMVPLASIDLKNGHLRGRPCRGGGSGAHGAGDMVWEGKVELVVGRLQRGRKRT